MDIYDMPDNIMDGMAYAIDNAYMIIIGASSHYANSPNCRMECGEKGNQTKSPSKFNATIKRTIKRTNELMHEGTSERTTHSNECVNEHVNERTYEQVNE
jgi:hypothetical protein